MKRRSYPPGPGPTAVLSNLAALRRDMLGFFHQMHEQYGDLVHLRVGFQRIVLLRDVHAIHRVLIEDADRFTKGRALRMSKELLGEGLLTSEGEFHLRQRRMIQPAFRPGQMSYYATHMTECADEFAREWEAGSTLDIHREMMRLTLLIAGRTLFGTSVREEVRTISDALSETLSLFFRVNLPFASLIGRLPLPSNRRFHAAKQQLDTVIHKLIARARTDRHTHQRHDLLTLLLSARDGENDSHRMTDQQVRDEALTLLLAGHETTAVAMTWTFHLLEQHPEAEAKLHAELDRVLAGRPATYEDIEHLPYTRRLLTESMRVRPPAYTIGRTPVEDYPIGDHIVPAGCQLLMSQHVIHRDPRHFSDPERFDPDRWADGCPENLPRFAYFPFGGGRRVCIGEGFAWTELIIALATLAQHFQLRLVPGHPVEAQPAITLRPKHGMRMTLHQRRPNHKNPVAEQ